MDAARARSALWLRALAYGAVGMLAQLVCRGVSDAAQSGNYELYVCASLWSAPLYATGLLGVEWLYLVLSARLRLPLRAAVYTAWLSGLQLGAGLLQAAVSDRTYDLSSLDFSLWGTVVLELLPATYVCAALAEVVLVRRLLALTPPPAGGRFTSGGASLTGHRMC